MVFDLKSCELTKIDVSGRKRRERERGDNIRICSIAVTVSLDVLFGYTRIGAEVWKF